ncbi:conserved hypothetical protein [Ricinus communis]|uniref:Uncharacterized protein n=1 Tax=Ricinus communis TaxID=3988 RepID=B9TQS4_RICCO|nr:conserved hypothetical protein [Ricinus communis]
MRRAREGAGRSRRSRSRRGRGSTSCRAARCDLRPGAGKRSSSHGAWRKAGRAGR